MTVVRGPVRDPLPPEAEEFVRDKLPTEEEEEEGARAKSVGAPRPIALSAASSKHNKCGRAPPPSALNQSSTRSPVLLIQQPVRRRAYSALSLPSVSA